MLSRSEIWEKLKTYVESPEICLFDIDLPSGSKGTLRVFIARRGKHSAGVTLEECAAVSKRISAAPEFDEMLHVFQLEISSPGVNRRLRNVEHYLGAVGERIKITTTASVTTENGSTKGSALVGILESFESGKLTLQLDQSDESVVLTVDQVSKARIDYLF